MQLVRTTHVARVRASADLPTVLKQEAEIVDRGERALVFVAERLASRRQCFAEELFGAIEAPLLLRHEAKIIHQVESAWMLVTQFLAASGERISADGRRQLRRWCQWRDQWRARW